MAAQALAGAPTAPSTVTTELDPAVERAILRCLEKDPAQRPRSAAAVAAALPGGDPLAAALAAGETPSPEMVAAAGETEGDEAGGRMGLSSWPSSRDWRSPPISRRGPTVTGTCRSRSRPTPSPNGRRRSSGGSVTPRSRSTPRGAFPATAEYRRWVEEHDQSKDRWKGIESGTSGGDLLLVPAESRPAHRGAIPRRRRRRDIGEGDRSTAVVGGNGRHGARPAGPFDPLRGGAFCRRLPRRPPTGRRTGKLSSPKPGSIARPSRPPSPAGSLPSTPTRGWPGRKGSPNAPIALCASKPPHTAAGRCTSSSSDRGAVRPACRQVSREPGSNAFQIFLASLFTVLLVGGALLARRNLRLSRGRPAGSAARGGLHLPLFHALLGARSEPRGQHLGVPALHPGVGHVSLPRRLELADLHRPGASHPAPLAGLADRLDTPALGTFHRSSGGARSAGRRAARRFRGYLERGRAAHAPRLRSGAADSSLLVE